MSALLIILIFQSLGFSQTGPSSCVNGVTDLATPPYREIPAGGWNFNLRSLVLQPRGSEIGFARQDMGYVNPVTMGFRTSSGVVPVQLSWKNGQLGIRPMGSLESESIPLAKVGEVVRNEESGDSYRPLEILVPGIKLVEELNRDLHQYSLLFPEGVLKDAKTETVKKTPDYEDVPEEGWNPRLSNLVIQDLGDGRVMFGRQDVGIVTESPLQFRDSKGILPVEIVREGTQFLIRKKGGTETVYFAEIGALKSDGDPGEEHQQLHFLLPGLKLVKEKDRSLKEYSIFLPDDVFEP